MSGKPSPQMIAAMRHVLAGMTPYAAAKHMGVALTTMYKSRLYKLWKAGDLDELERELLPTR